MEQDTRDRFWAKVRKLPGDTCWEWTACIARDVGYGLFWNGERLVSAHRFSYLMEHGSIPDGLYVCHHCDNRRCVRPEHLYAADQSRNLLDCVKRGRHNPKRGEASNLAKITEDDVRDIRARYARGERQAAIGRDYGIKQPTVSGIVNHHWWAHVG